MKRYGVIALWPILGRSQFMIFSSESRRDKYAAFLKTLEVKAVSVFEVLNDTEECTFATIEDLPRMEILK